MKTKQPKYIETPRRCTAPVRIDEMLEARMQAFVRTRTARLKGAI